MRKFVFVVFCMSLMMLFVGTGCTDKKTTSTEPVSVDSMLVDSLGTDSMEALIEDEPMPKAADELFDDLMSSLTTSFSIMRQTAVFRQTVLTIPSALTLTESCRV